MTAIILLINILSDPIIPVVLLLLLPTLISNNYDHEIMSTIEIDNEQGAIRARRAFPYLNPLLKNTSST